MRVLLLDRDKEYASRIAQFLSKKTTDMQVSACDDLEIARKLIREEHFQVILFDAEFDFVDPAEFRKRNTAFDFLSSLKETVNETETIYKFCSVSEMYGEIMRVYADHTQHELKTEDDTEETETVRSKLISFFPVNGGAGSSTMAMAAAIALAKEKKVLYIPLEQRHSEMLMFSAKDIKGLTDVVSMLRTNYDLKESKKLFEKIIRTSEKYGNGNLDFIPGFLNITDCLSMTPAVLDTMLGELRKKFQYHYIVIDADFILGDLLTKLIGSSDKIVFVCTGSDTSNAKIDGIHRYLEIIERDIEIMPKKYLIFNQYYGLASEEAVVRDMKVIGRFGRYRAENHMLLSTDGVISQILGNDDPFRDLM